MHVLSILLCVFMLIQLVETEKGKNLNGKPKLEVLHASLKEQPLLLSIL